MDSSRKCRKCEEIIPNWIKVDGKSRNLKNRIYEIIEIKHRMRNYSQKNSMHQLN